MKTMIKAVIALMTLALVILAFSGCELDDFIKQQTKCEHNFTEATCSLPKTCSICGVTEGEALGHTEEALAGKDATCKEAGLTDGKKCSVCGEILVAQEAIPATGHTEEILKGEEPTCTEPGLTEGKKCSVCYEILVAQEEIAKKGHTEETVAGKDATCTETGLTEGKKCSVCDEILVAQEEIPTIAHTEEIIAGKDATCTATGLTEGKKCSVCDTITVPQKETPTIDHSYTIKGETVDPTVLTDGYTVYTCEHCGASTKLDIVPALGAVAQAGETKYATLEEAIAVGGEVILLENVTIKAMIEIPEGKEVILDLNGKTIDVAYVEGSTTNHIYLFTNNGTLTIKGNGVINARGIFNYGTMTLENGTINTIDGNGGYGVRNYEGSSFTMNGGVIAATYEDDNKVDEGGYDATPLRVDAGATFVMNGGELKNVCDFTMALDNSGTATINNGKLSSVHTTVANYGTLVINGGEFACDGLEGITAHVIWAAEGEVTINGGTFDGKDNYNGFNVDASEGALVNINGGTFKNVHSGSLYGKGTIVVKGGTFFDETLNRVAEGYHFVDGVVSAHIPGTDATCTTSQVCTVCNVELVAATGHSIVKIEGKAATCTETGLTEGKKCSSCGEILVAQEEIPTIAHTEEIIAGKDATCTEAGITDGKKCSACGTVLVEQSVIPAGHKLENGICTVCGVVPNVFAGKVFVPSSDAAGNMYSSSFGYQTITDGIIFEEGKGRFSSKQNGGKVEATIDLGAVYDLNEFKVYLYWKGLSNFGSGLKIEVLFAGEWTTVIDCTSVEELQAYWVDNPDNIDKEWLIFDLGGVAARQLRFTIPGQTSAAWTTFYEMECSAKVSEKVEPEPEEPVFVENIFAGKQFTPTDAAKSSVLVASWWMGGGYETLTDGIKNADNAPGRFSTVMKATGMMDATIDLGGAYELHSLKFYTYDKTSTGAGSVGADLLIQVYADGEWKDVVVCSDNASVMSHLVVGDGAYDDYLEFNLGGIVAEKVRIYISASSSSSGTTYEEIECNGYAK